MSISLSASQVGHTWDREAPLMKKNSIFLPVSHKPMHYQLISFLLFLSLHFFSLVVWKTEEKFDFSKAKDGFVYLAKNW